MIRYANMPGGGGGGGLVPFTALAIGADGLFSYTLPIVSQQAWTIHEIFQTPSASTISIRLDVIPNPVPTVLTVRVDAGMNGTTRGIHPADGDSWTVTPGADPFTFTLVGSTWVANSVAWTGGNHCYVPGTIFDASDQLNVLALWCRNNAPATVYLPLGGMYLLNTKVDWPESTTVIGHGGRRTWFFGPTAADKPSTLHHMMGNGGGSSTLYGNVANTRWQGFSLYGCRERNVYNQGNHAVDLGSDSDTTVALNIWLEDIHIYGSAGYGFSWGGGNAKTYCYVTHCEVAFTDGDGVDCKNKINGNFVINYDTCTFAWHALGQQGTNLQPNITLTNNCINITTTDSGHSLFTIPLTQDSPAQAGEIATFSNAPTVNGINFNGSFRIVLVSSGTGKITLDSLQTASGTATGVGGSGIVYNCPHISDGDTAIDMRGIFSSARNCTWTGEVFGRNVFRGRGGPASGPNGLGASYAQITGCQGYDLTPAWVNGTGNSGNFIDLEGEGQLAANFSWYTQGGASGFLIGAASHNCKVSNFYIEGSYNGGLVRGDRSKVCDGHIVNYTNYGLQVDGATQSQIQYLTSDPFMPTSTAANPTVTNVFAQAYGQGASFSVTFSGVHNTNNGITVGPSSVVYTGTQVDADNFTIPAAGQATNLLAFGGDSAAANYGTTPHVVEDVVLSNITFRLDAARTVGSNDINLSTRCTRTKIIGCTFSSGASEAVVIADNPSAQDTIWGPANSGGIWNVQTVYNLPTSGSVTLTSGDGGKLLILPSNASAQVTINLPDPATAPPSVWFDVICNDNHGVKFVTPSGAIVDGASTSSSGGSIATSSGGARLRINWKSTSGWNVGAKTGTWTLA